MSLEDASNILVAHKDPLARAYLRGLIERAPLRRECAEADNFNSVVEYLRNDQDTELALIDVDLPGMASDLGLRFFGMHFDRPRFVALFSSLTSDRIERLMQAGLAGCIPKDLSEAALVRTIQMILSGSTYLPSGVDSQPDQPAMLADPHGPIDQELTERQGEVLQLLALGHSNREIGQMLHIAEGTVKVHVNAAFRVLGVHNRVSAAAAIRRRMEESHLIEDLHH
jgi:DNA-binding NarL/FixJ family response regulator